MTEVCENRGCLMASRVEALEQEAKNNRDDHNDIFLRLRNAETVIAVQNSKYDEIIAKLNAVTAKLEALEAKPGKRWDGLVDKLIWAVAGAVVAFLLAKAGL